MSKVLNSIFIGLVLFLVIDIIFFAGLKRGYLDALEIKEYFNPFFADNQCWLLWLISPLLGYIFLYSPFSRSIQLGYVGVVLLSLLIMSPSVGYTLGEMVFLKENKKMELFGKQRVTTALYFEGRDYVYIKALKGERVIKIEKESVRFLD